MIIGSKLVTEISYAVMDSSSKCPGNLQGSVEVSWLGTIPVPFTD